MLKTLSYGLKALSFSWKANGLNSIVFIVSKIYEGTLYPFIQVYLLAQLLDLISQSQIKNFEDLGSLVTFYVLATLLRISLTSYLDVKDAYLTFRLESYLDYQISQKLTELDPATLENPEFQNLIAQIEGVKGSMQAHLMRFIGLIEQVVKFITAAIVISAIYPLFIPLILITAVPSYIAWDKFRVKTWPFYMEKRSLLTRVTQYIKNLLSSDSTSKEAAIFKTGPVLLFKIKKEQESYYKSFNRSISPWFLAILGSRVIQLGVFLYTQHLLLSQVLKGALGIGQLTLFFQQTLNLVFSSEEILNQYSSIAARNKYLDKFFEFMDTKPAIKIPSNPIDLPQNPTPPTIEFKNVSFRYPQTERDILSKFNLVIQSGEKIALVGENGAGKSTIIKLLLRFYDVTEGEILVNGINIKDLDLKLWHSYIGALFQDFIKYQLTFKENVFFGDLSKSQDMDQLKKAIEQSGAENYLDNLPNRHSQMLGKMFEGGIDLSGGQWQKLALARAFYRDAPILILDEPTSAIDAKAEYEIFERVQKLQKDKTVIIISHRFSTVRNADKILVLDEGRIIEEGNHSELMKKKGLYAELFNIQAQGYK